MSRSSRWALAKPPPTCRWEPRPDARDGRMSRDRSHSPAGASRRRLRVGDRGLRSPRSAPASTCSGSPTAAPRRPVRSRTSSTRGSTRAVRAFQQLRGLSVDGVVGPQHVPRPRGGALAARRPAADPRRREPARRGRRARAAAAAARPGLQGRQGRRPLRPPRPSRRSATSSATSACRRTAPAGRPPSRRCPGSPRWSAAAAPTRCAPRSGSAAAGPQLTGKIVVIDPVARPASTGPAPAAAEADAITTDLARRIEGRLVATGVQAFLTTTRRRRRRGRGGARRVRQPHRRRPVHLAARRRLGEPRRLRRLDVLLRLEAHGVGPRLGERFAGLVQREIVARTDLADLRSHPKTWDLLRHTRMPAVRLERGYLTNAGDPGGSPTRPSATSSPRPSWSPSSGSTSHPDDDPHDRGAAARRAPAALRPRPPQPAVLDARRWSGPPGEAPAAGCRTDRTAPSSRSSAASTSSRQVQRRPQLHPHPRVARVRPLGLEAHPQQEVGRQHAAAVPPSAPGARVSPNASTARMPPRLTQVAAIACTSIRPSPPPPYSGIDHGGRRAAPRPSRPARSGRRRRRARTPPGRRGRSRPGRRRRTTTRPHEPHSRSTVETQVSFSAPHSAGVGRPRCRPDGVELPEHARPAAARPARARWSSVRRASLAGHRHLPTATRCWTRAVARPRSLRG